MLWNPTLRGGTDVLKRYEDGLVQQCLLRDLLLMALRSHLLSEDVFVRDWHAPYLFILRKEVIQPQVPLRLPCYDFTPVAELTVVRCPLERLAHGLRVNPTPMV